LIPEVVTVAKDATTGLNLVLVSVSSVTVQVTVYDEVPKASSQNRKDGEFGPDDLRATGGLVGEVVEISNGRELYRRVTGPTGEAAFSRLRPGEWRLTTYDSMAPPKHRMENADRRLTLKAGEKRTEVFRVLPKRRNIKMIELSD
jgi:hypothetical protein